MTNEQKIAALWKLLDDLDTLDDAAKGDDALFRRHAYRIQRMRFQIVSGEEYDLIQAPTGGRIDE